MSDLRQQIQQHYAAQALPAAKLDAILAEGRAAHGVESKVVKLSARRATPWRPILALAATILVLATIAFLWLPSRNSVSYANLAPSVVELFAGKGPALPKRSQNPEELRTWLLAQGAPADFQIPEKLRLLKSFGCEVLDVHGKPAYLTCFWAEKKADADDGSLVHLLVARRGDFKDAPSSGVPQFHALKDWSFASWSEGDVIYTMAANAPMEKLRKFIAAETALEGDWGLAGAGQPGYIEFVTLAHF